MHYAILFQKNIRKVVIIVLTNSKNKVNVINSTYMAKIDIRVYKIDIDV